MPYPERLLQAAQIAWQRGKPLLVNKIATGEPGAVAAMAHTGSRAGFDPAYRAAFERGGAIIVDEFEGLMEAASFFAKAPPPAAHGVAVAATSGGAAIMSADVAHTHGVPLPQPSPEVRQVLASLIPEFGSSRNPCDVTGQVVNNPQSLWECAAALLSDPAYGALVAPQTVVSETNWQPRIDALQALSKQYGKITCNVLLSNWLQGPGLFESERHTHVAVFRSMDRCFRTLAAWHRRADRLARSPRSVMRSAPSSAAAAAQQLIEASPTERLSESDCAAVLSLYGIALRPRPGHGQTAEAIGAPLNLIVAAQFEGLGPLIMLRLGGASGKLVPEPVVDLAAINHEEAVGLLRKLTRDVLEDVEGLANVLVRVSELAADQQQLIAEVQVQVTAQTAGRFVIGDALLVRAT
jgi:acyl-CoA synthetase (NDP forming)